MDIDTEATAIGFVLLSIGTIYLTIVFHTGHRFTKLIMRKGYRLHLALLLAWCIIILKFNAFNLIQSKERVQRLKKATLQGLIALVIATLAYMGLTIPTLWFILLITYYFETHDAATDTTL